MHNSASRFGLLLGYSPPVFGSMRFRFLFLLLSIFSVLCLGALDPSDLSTIETELDHIHSLLSSFKSSNDSHLYYVSSGLETDIGSIYSLLSSDLGSLNSNVGSISSVVSGLSSNVSSFKSKFDEFYDRYKLTMVDYVRHGTPPRLDSYSDLRVGVVYDPYSYKTLTSISNSVSMVEDVSRQQLDIQSRILQYLTNMPYQSSTFSNILWALPLTGFDPYSSLIPGSGFASYTTWIISQLEQYQRTQDISYLQQLFSYGGAWRDIPTALLSVIYRDPRIFTGRSGMTFYNNMIKDLLPYSDFSYSQPANQLFAEAYYREYGTYQMTTNIADLWFYGTPALSNLNVSMSSSFGKSPLSDVVSDDGTFNTNAPAVRNLLSSLLPSDFSSPSAFTNAALSPLNQDSVDSARNNVEEQNAYLNNTLSPVVNTINSDFSTAVSSVLDRNLGTSWTVNGFSGFVYRGIIVGAFETIAFNRPSWLPSFSFVGWCIRIVVYFGFVYAIVRKYVNKNQQSASDSSWQDDF